VLELSPMTTPDGITIRRDLLPGDVEAIVALHSRIYTAEHAMGPGFVLDVADALSQATDEGWPRRGGVWLVEVRGELAGTIAWTDEGDQARIRWVLLDSPLRGQGFGRSLIEDVVGEIDAAGYELIVLTTFSDLRVAAHVYRSLGFVLVSSQPHVSWGPTVELQRYERRR
jgi:GNAT superfamily N-acetyltransferase